MLELMRHIVTISSLRDRTEINGALVGTLKTLFGSQSIVLYRCYPAKECMVFACAGTESGKIFTHNAYVPNLRYCKPIHEDQQLAQCWQTQKEQVCTIDNAGRVIIPIIQNREVFYIIDLVLSALPAPEQVELLKGMVHFFNNFVALLDYGETDILTGLPSRKTFEKHLYELMESAVVCGDVENTSNLARRKPPVGDVTHWLAVCDIDDFKSVNNAFGHMIGDEVLIMLARTLRQSFRFTDHLFRYGGEEFVIMLQPTDDVSAHNVFERFRSTVERETFSRVGHITVSIGYTRLMQTDTLDSAVNRADEAVYYAKQHGRNQVACHEQLLEKNELIAKDLTYGDIELF